MKKIRKKKQNSSESNYSDAEEENNRQQNKEKMDQLIILEGKIARQQENVERAYRRYQNMYRSSGMSLSTASYIFDLQDAVQTKKKLYQKALNIAEQMEGDQGQNMVESYNIEIDKCNTFLQEISKVLDPTRGQSN